MIPTIIIYNAMLFGSLFFGYLGQQSDNRILSRTCYLYSMLILILPTVFRYDTGPDYKGYVGIFNDVYAGYAKTIYVEHSYFYLNKLFSFTTYGYVYVLGIYAILTFYLLFKFTEWKYVPYFCFFFMTLNVGYFTLDDQVRQALAMSIYIYSLRYIESNNLIKYSLICCAAALIHTSAILMLPAFFLAKINISKKLAIVIIIAMVFSFFTGATQFLFKHIFSLVPFFDFYAYRSAYTGASEATGTGLGVLLNVISFSLCIYYKDELNHSRYVNLVFFGIVLLLFSAGNLNIVRMSKYYLIIGIFMLSHIFHRKKTITTLAIILSLVVFFQKTIIHRQDINLGYQFIGGKDFFSNYIRSREY